MRWQLVSALHLTRRHRASTHPCTTTVRFTDGLWQHTCFEAFVAVKGETAYREFNFSPSSQWAAYAFSVTTASQLNHLSFLPSLRKGLGNGECLSKIANPPINWMPPSHPLPCPPPRAQLALTAVIELTDGSKSYWALKHPGERPDTITVTDLPVIWS